MGKQKEPRPEPAAFGSIEGAATHLELPIDDAWREAVKARLKEMRRGQDELGAHIGCSQANLSQALSVTGKRRGQKTSVHAHAISLAVGVPLPGRAVALLVADKGLSDDATGYDLQLQGFAKQFGIRLVPANSGPAK